MQLSASFLEARPRLEIHPPPAKMQFKECLLSMTAFIQTQIGRHLLLLLRTDDVSKSVALFRSMATTMQEKGENKIEQTLYKPARLNSQSNYRNFLQFDPRIKHSTVCTCLSRHQNC